MDVSVNVDWHDGRVKAIAKQAAQAACEAFGMAIQNKAQALAPHKEGTLEGSASTDPIGGGRIGARVSFGGPADLYAIVQHEDTGLAHPGGRQAKYLETPFKANIPQFPRFVELMIRASVKAGSVQKASGTALGGGA